MPNNNYRSRYGGNPNGRDLETLQRELEENIYGRELTPDESIYVGMAWRDGTLRGMSPQD